MKKRLFALLMAMCCLAGCHSGENASVKTNDTDVSPATSSPAATTETEGEKILVIADTQGPTSLDLAQSWDSWYTSRMGITETMFRLDETLTPQPWLCESLEQTEEMTWVLTVKDGITFQNGNPLTAQSVQDCWERTASLNPRFLEVLPISSMTSEGQRLTITTSEPLPAMANALSEPLTGVIDVSSDTDMASSPIGTGPFQAVSFTAGQEITVKQYADYWGGVPALDGAVMHIISDTNTLALAQQQGETDVTVSMPAASLSLFEGNDDFHVDGAAGSRGEVVYFNFDTPALQNLAVRQALSMVADKEGYASVLNHGASVSTKGLYPDFMAFGAKEAIYSYDLDEAARVLDEAGIVDQNGDGIREYDGVPLSLRLVTYSTKAELPLFASEFGSSAGRIGIEVNVEVYESVAEQERSGDFDLLLISFAMVPTGDPQYFAEIAFHSQGSSNYGGYANEKVDELIAVLSRTTGTEERAALAQQIQQLVLEDAGYLVFGHAKYYYISGAQVQHLVTNPSEYYLLDASVDLS